MSKGGFEWDRRRCRRIKYGIMEAITDWLHCDERYEKTRWCEWDTRIRAPKDAYLWWEMRVEMRLSTSTQGSSSYTVSKKASATKRQHQIETKKLNQRPYRAKLSTVVLIGWQRPLKNLLTLGTRFYNKRKRFVTQSHPCSHTDLILIYAHSSLGWECWAIKRQRCQGRTFRWREPALSQTIMSKLQSPTWKLYGG